MTRRVRMARGDRIEVVDLEEYAGGPLVEEALRSANAWIKSLRALPVDGRPFRDRFTYRGDSLWWFAELFLHREGAIAAVWRTALALQALCRSEAPAALGIADPDPVVQLLLPQVARQHGIGLLEDTGGGPPEAARLRSRLKGHAYTWAARASRWLPSRGTPPLQRDGTLAFVHAAFWRSPASPTSRNRDASGSNRIAWEGEEGYIGPVLEALAQSPAAPVQLIGIGPRRNFRARRWWHPLAPSWRRAAGGGAVVPIERLTRAADLRGSLGIWKGRHEVARALLGSEALREASRIAGLDAWPLVREQLRGIATLQFPWSARAMDEAGAAIERAAPRLVLTYAEAGGWGRAIVLEARRRGVPSAGLQHGFIYRHWLNYLHEPDEMVPSAENPADRGFPRPDLTLLYDRYAADHLEHAGAFPPQALAVTGSPALDRLATAVRRIGPADRTALRRSLGVAAGGRMALLVAKRAQLGRWLPLLIEAAGRVEGLHLVMKPHPAEVAAPYEEASVDATWAMVAPGTLELPQALAAADLVVTVNSTVAIDAMVLGIPSLAVALPNNLSPFVELGAMAGVERGDALEATLRDVAGPTARRDQLLSRGRAVAEKYGMRADGRSVDRACGALAGLASRRPPVTIQGEPAP